MDNITNFRLSFLNAILSITTYQVFFLYESVLERDNIGMLMRVPVRGVSVA